MKLRFKMSIISVAITSCLSGYASASKAGELSFAGSTVAIDEKLNDQYLTDSSGSKINVDEIISSGNKINTYETSVSEDDVLGGITGELSFAGSTTTIDEKIKDLYLTDRSASQINAYEISTSVSEVREIISSISDETILSSHIYNTSGANKNNPIVGTDYKLVKYVSDSSGFNGGVYQNSEGKLIVSLGGTTAKDINNNKSDLFVDIVADIKLLKISGSESAQFIALRDLLDSSFLKNKQYSITGHSLGGGLAQYASLYTGMPAVTFNTAPMTINEEALSHLPKPALEKMKSDIDNIQNYSTVFDPLTAILLLQEKVELYQGVGPTPIELLEIKSLVFLLRNAPELATLYKLNMFVPSSPLHGLSKLVVKGSSDIVPAVRLLAYLKKYLFKIPADQKLGKLIHGKLITLNIESGHSMDNFMAFNRNVYPAWEDISNDFKLGDLSEEVLALSVISDNAARDALATNITESVQRIETTRKLELDRRLAKTDVDIFFLADNTGSMGGLIDSVQLNSQSILNALKGDSRFDKVNMQFGVGAYLGDPSEFSETMNTSYQLLQTITSDDVLINSAINNWSATGGGDWEEGNFYAIQQALTNGEGTIRDDALKSQKITGWREGAEKVVVVFGDAPSWQNSVNEKELKDLVKKIGAKIVFIDTNSINSGLSQNVFNANSGQQMMDSAIEIADASAGSYMQLTDVSLVRDAVLNSVFDALADNTFTGGMLVKKASEYWRVRTPSSVTATTSNGGDSLTFTLRYPSQVDSSFNVDTTTATSVAGTKYFETPINNTSTIFGSDMSTSAILHLNQGRDFYRFLMEGSGAVLDGYYGERLSSSSKLPTSGVSTYDLRQSIKSPYGSGFVRSSDNMKMFINWATGKVYAFEHNADLSSTDGSSIFIGSVDKSQLEITGEYTFKSRRLTAGEVTTLPRFIKDAMRNTTTLQLYGSNTVNGLGGTFGATYYDESKSPILSSMVVSGFKNKDLVSKVYSPVNNEVWRGFATGMVSDRNSGAVVIAESTNISDVEITLKPTTGEMMASVSVEASGNNYTFSSDSSDSNVYINKDAFAVVKEVSGVPAYVATTITEDDGYSYLSWGVWSTEVANQTVMDGSSWIAGTLTSNINMPTTGTASYAGMVQGVAYESGQLKSLNGTTSLNADFAANTVSGSLTVNYANAGGVYASTNLSGVSITGNQFGGGLTGSGVNNGTIDGAFFGTSASEVGGKWQLDKTNGSKATGVFSGK